MNSSVMTPELAALYAKFADDPDTQINFPAEVTRIPVIKLTQAQRPVDLSMRHIPNGHWAHCSYEVDLGVSLRVAVIDYRTSRVRFKGKYPGVSVVCRSLDGTRGIGDPGGDCASCPLHQWAEDDTPPECVAGLNYFVLPLDADGNPLAGPNDNPYGLTLLRMQRSSFREGRRWNDMISKNTPHFATIYRLDITEAQSKAGPYFRPHVEIDGRIMDAFLLQRLHESVKECRKDTQPLQQAVKQADDAPDPAADFSTC